MAAVAEEEEAVVVDDIWAEEEEAWEDEVEDTGKRDPCSYKDFPF